MWNVKILRYNGSIDYILLSTFSQSDVDLCDCEKCWTCQKSLTWCNNVLGDKTCFEM